MEVVFGEGVGGEAEEGWVVGLRGGGMGGPVRSVRVRVAMEGWVRRVAARAWPMKPEAPVMRQLIFLGGEDMVVGESSIGIGMGLEGYKKVFAVESTPIKVTQGCCVILLSRAGS